MNAVENKHRNSVRGDEKTLQEDPEMVLEEVENSGQPNDGRKKERKTVLDKWADKLKEFLDNAE